MADIFTEDKPVTDVDPNKDYYEELVGDGKRFKDNKALAHSKVEGDSHIKRIEADNAALRDELKQKVALQEVLDQLRALRNEPKEEPHTPPEGERKGLTPEELEALFESKLAARDSLAVAKQNQDYVQEELKKRFGSEELVRAEVSRKAKELDMKPEVLRDMAQKTPKAFLTLMGERTQKTSDAAPRTSISGSTNFSPTGARTQKDWQELRKRDPVSYHSKELTIKRHNDAIALGDAFFNQ